MKEGDKKIKKKKSLDGFKKIVQWRGSEREKTQCGISKYLDWGRKKLLVISIKWNWNLKQCLTVCLEKNGKKRKNWLSIPPELSRWRLSFHSSTSNGSASCFLAAYFTLIMAHWDARFIHREINLKKPLRLSYPWFIYFVSWNQPCISINFLLPSALASLQCFSASLNFTKVCHRSNYVLSFFSLSRHAAKSHKWKLIS